MTPHSKSATLVLALVLACSAPAGAVVIVTEDGSGNTTAPPDDPGWAHVGKLGGLSAVYLDAGWILTAHHVASLAGVFRPQAPPSLLLAGERIPIVQRSAVELKNPDGSRADLVLLRLESRPALPALALAEQPASVGRAVVLIGRGKDRSSPLRFWTATFQPATPRQFRYAGYDWDPARNVKRWGTNLVGAADLSVPGPGGRRTLAFATAFDHPGTRFEAQAVKGDSGGGVFHRSDDGSWRLAGVLISTTSEKGQGDRAVFGNWSVIADLARYREQIRATIAAD